MNTRFNIIHVSLVFGSAFPYFNQQTDGRSISLFMGLVNMITNGIPRDVSSTNRKTSVMYFM